METPICLYNISISPPFTARWCWAPAQNDVAKLCKINMLLRHKAILVGRSRESFPVKNFIIIINHSHLSYRDWPFGVILKHFQNRGQESSCWVCPLDMPRYTTPYTSMARDVLAIAKTQGNCMVIVSYNIYIYILFPQILVSGGGFHQCQRSINPLPSASTPSTTASKSRSGRRKWAWHRAVRSMAFPLSHLEPRHPLTDKNACWIWGT